MKYNQKFIIGWASLRAIYLYNSHRYEDSYAVSQEFLEWTTPNIFFSDGPKASTLKVPNFNKENRTN